MDTREYGECIKPAAPSPSSLREADLMRISIQVVRRMRNENAVIVLCSVVAWHNKFTTRNASSTERGVPGLKA
jgi:hypothetical protein